MIEGTMTIEESGEMRKMSLSAFAALNAIFNDCNAKIADADRNELIGLKYLKQSGAISATGRLAARNKKLVKQNKKESPVRIISATF